MQEICAEAELSPGAVYRYYRSKTDIIAAIAEDDRRRMEGALALVDSEELIDAVCCFAETFVDNPGGAGDAPLMADVISEALRNGDFAKRLRRAGAPLEQRLAEAVKTGQHAGAFRANVDPRRAARIILGAVDGLCLRASVRGEPGAAIGADVRLALESLLQPRSRAARAPWRASAPESSP